MSAEAGKPVVPVMVPADVDILLGRGKPFQNHPGNQRMLTLVDKYRDRYQVAERKEKHDIVEEVMGLISGSGGRFLRRVDYENYWVEVAHAVAYRKVGHAFRSKARKTDSSSKPAPEMTRQRVEAPALNNSGMAPSNMEEMLLADLRMRRAALHQADFLNNMNNVNMNNMNMNNMNMNNMNMNNMNMNNMNMNNMNMNNMNMNNIAAMAAGTPLERFLLPTLYNNIAAAGFLQQGLQGGLMNPNVLAANAALMGNPAFNNAENGEGQKASAAPSQEVSPQQQETPQENGTPADNLAPVASAAPSGPPVAPPQPSALPAAVV
ncbi:unnamed protein product [Cylindrotheca closterium]|uniref:DUF6824 domain-containing protein n=1 Tax=Cylindrotheca closterium TaxID=2856 RepID=A0AAD2FT37_9STRA|nr:unnamed protein product [Cylindrotheca closterium]